MFSETAKTIKISNLGMLNAVLYVVENGCKWRRLPKEHGDWHVIYVRVNRWAKKGVLQTAFLRLQRLGILREAISDPLPLLWRKLLPVRPGRTAPRPKITSSRISSCYTSARWTPFHTLFSGGVLSASACRRSPFSAVEHSKKVAVFERHSKNSAAKPLYITEK